LRYTYSRWDGTQALEGVDPDELMDAISDDLMADGDLESALQRVTRWGLGRNGGEPKALGLQDLLQQLRTQRQSELETYNLDSILQDVQDRVSDVVETERAGLERRLGEPGGEGAWQRMLGDIVERKLDSLDHLPDEPGSAVTALAEYEFLDEQAREKFGALTEMLERHMLQRHFQSMEQLLRGMSAGDTREDVKSMLRDLNALLRDHAAGRDGGFDDFARRHGRHFPEARSVGDVVDLMQEQASHTQALMESMSAEMRHTLDRMMATILERDHELRDELTRVAESLQAIAPLRITRRDYPFSGDQTLSLEEGMRLMRRMHDLDQLEKSLRHGQETGELAGIDPEQVRRVMGESSHGTLEQLKRLVDVLQQAGYVERRGDALELTSRGIRKIGQKALEDIFTHLKRDTLGEHTVSAQGGGGDRSEDTKPYEFGDSFLLDLHGTLMNAVERAGPGTPVELGVADFEVFRTEQLTHTSTVLMLDMSRSMPLRGCFVAAKKVALALNSLIRLQYPRDQLYIVGFSDYARLLRPESLHRISWGDYVYGTNMQHGLMLARRLLGRRHSGTKQVILITDGEPTAHIEGGRVHFAYPPTFRTFQETLREVRRCTQEGIIINTFMLERSHYLADFVNQMTRINGGRAFFATPESLGDYIVVDYVKNRQHAIS
jgi:uncharacterized protein with von Willebrand factor type A (vWA) domain